MVILFKILALNSVLMELIEMIHSKFALPVILNVVLALMGLINIVLLAQLICLERSSQHQFHKILL